MIQSSRSSYNNIQICSWAEIHFDKDETCPRLSCFASRVRVLERMQVIAEKAYIVSRFLWLALKTVIYATFP